MENKYTIEEKTVGHKRKINGYSHKKVDVRKNKLREEAFERQARYDTLSLDEKLKLVTDRFLTKPGESKKELNRLIKLRDNPSKKNVVVTTAAKEIPVVVIEKPKNKYKKINKKEKAA